MLPIQLLQWYYTLKLTIVTVISVWICWLIVLCKKDNTYHKGTILPLAYFIIHRCDRTSNLRVWLSAPMESMQGKIVNTVLYTHLSLKSYLADIMETWCHHLSNAYIFSVHAHETWPSWMIVTATFVGCFVVFGICLLMKGMERKIFFFIWHLQ